MAMKRAVKFALNFLGDGSATEFEFLLAGAPVWFEPAVAGAVPQPTFDLGTLHPTDVRDVTSNGPSVSSAEITVLGTKLKVTFSSAPGAAVYNVSGSFVF